MNRPFAIYPDSFDGNSLGYWRFGERGSRLTPVGAGPTFANHGAEARQDGYRTDATDYMDAAFNGMDALPKVTLEAWVRDWSNPDDVRGCVFIFYNPVTWADYITIRVCHQTPPTVAYWNLMTKVGGEMKSDIVWWGGEEILVSPDPFHVAVVLDAASTPKTFRLFVNGVKRAEGSGGAIAGLPADDYRLRLARAPGASDYTSAILDEVRLSAAARYAANFPVTRFGEGRRALARGPGTRAGLFAGVVG